MESILSPPDEIKEWYAITWSPKGTTYDPQTKYNEHIYDVFNKWAKALNFAIFPELNNNGNIHYHGVIRIIDKIAWYRRLLPLVKHKGFVLIKRIDNWEKWTTYITKDVDINKILFDPYPLTTNNLPKRTRQRPTPDLDYEIGILKWISSRDREIPNEEKSP